MLKHQGDVKVVKSRENGGLRHTTDLLLGSPSNAAVWLKTADRYIQSYLEDPKGFVLPKDYAFLRPLIEHYAYDLEGFVHYVVGVRDCFERKTAPFVSLQQLYRTIMGRYVQQVRRERADRAIAKAQELYGDTDFHTRLQWVSKLEHDWAQRRLDFLAKYRERSENNRISTDERTELLAEFWDAIETEIHNGELPPWN